MDACDEALHRNGLVYTQLIACSEGPIKFGLVTRLVHFESGEEITSSCPLIFNESGTNPMQSFGASVSYARRYSLQSLAGIQTEDDDAEGAFPREQSRDNKKQYPKTKKGPQFRVDREYVETLTAAQITAYDKEHENDNIEDDDKNFLREKWVEKKKIERASQNLQEKRAAIVNGDNGKTPQVKQ